MTTFSPGTAASADFVVSVPGRVNLIGEHTDYNQGWVLPVAIERSIQMVVRRRDDRLATLRSGNNTHKVTVDLTRPIRPGNVLWGRYVEGVLAGYQNLGWTLSGFDAEFSATLPTGGGLSSSAALELAVATAVETLCQKSLPPLQRALLCQTAEHEFANVPCGIMDQFAITFAQAGHALLLDCRSREMSHVPLERTGVLILVINSGVKHALADGEYAKRRAQCGAAAECLNVPSLRDVGRDLLRDKGPDLPEPLRRRARHVVSENERTLLFVEALKSSEWNTAGRLMYESHQSLSLDYQVSCPELDQLVELAREVPGVFGCRMTGGGFGGCAVALVERALAPAGMEKLAQRYQAATGITPTLFLTHATGGPAVMPPD